MKSVDEDMNNEFGTKSNYQPLLDALNGTKFTKELATHAIMMQVTAGGDKASWKNSGYNKSHN